MGICKKIGMTLAATGFILTPVAAQAGTRAETSPVTVDAAHSAVYLDTENDHRKKRFRLVWLLLSLAVVAAVLTAASGGRTRGG